MAGEAYATCLMYMAHSLRWREALGILDHVRAFGITPDVKSVSAALNACGQAGEWQRYACVLSIAGMYEGYMTDPSSRSRGKTSAAGVRMCEHVVQFERLDVENAVSILIQIGSTNPVHVHKNMVVTAPVSPSCGVHSPVGTITEESEGFAVRDCSCRSHS